jgi:hypothetical protein
MTRLASIGALTVHQPLTLSIYNQLEASTDWDYVPGPDITSVTGGNTITITSRHHKVTISGGTIDTITDPVGPVAGQLLELYCVNANTIRNNGGGTGNIRTIAGGDVSVSAGQVATFVYDGSFWREQVPVDAAILNASGGLTIPSTQSAHGSTAVGGDGTHSGYILEDTGIAGLLASVAVNPANVVLSATVAGDTTGYRVTITAGGVITLGSGAGAGDTTISRTAPGQIALGGTTGFGNFIRGGASNNAGGPATLTPDAACFFSRWNLINASGTYTIAAPTNPPGANQSAVINLCIHNSSGGAVTLAWNAAYSGTMTTPGNGTGVVYQFVWNPGTSKWTLCVSTTE